MSLRVSGECSGDTIITMCFVFWRMQRQEAKIGSRANTKIETPTGRRGAGCVGALEAWHQTSDWGRPASKHSIQLGVSALCMIRYCDSEMIRE